MLTSDRAAATFHPGRLLGGAVFLALVATAMVLAVYVSRYLAMVLMVAAAAAMFASAGAYAGRLQSFALGFFVFTATVAADIPFTQEAVTGGTRPGLVIWISDLALVVLLTLLFIRWAIRIDGPRSPRSPTARILVLLFACFIAWELVSALGAVQLRYAIFQVIRDVLAIPIMLAVLATVRTLRDVRFVCLVLLAAIGFHLVLAIAQLIHGGPFGLSFLGELHQADARSDIFQTYTGEALTLGPLTITRHFSGLVGGSYKLAAVIILILPLAFVTTMVKRRHPGVLFLSLAGISMVILSQSRGAWGGLLIAILSFAWLLSREKRDRSQSSGRILGGALVLVILVAVPLFTFIRTRLLETNLSETALIRMELIRSGLRMLSHPFRGIGPNNFAILFEGIPSLGLQRGLPIHNIYALHLIETGIVGLALYLLLLAVILRLGIRMARRAKAPVSGYAAAITASIIGLSAWGVLTWLYRDHVVYTVFWILAGLLLSLERVTVPAKPPPSTVSNDPPR